MKFEIYQDKAGEFRWRLKAANGETIADSGEGYKEKRDCKNGLGLVRTYAIEAKVVDLTEKKN